MPPLVVGWVLELFTCLQVYLSVVVFSSNNQTVAATTLSSLHCADHCSRRNDTACNMYVYEPSGPTCYLGNIQEEYDHLPTAPVAPDAKVGVNMGEDVFSPWIAE